MILLDNLFDLIVLGAGSGGLAAAKRAASYGARVAIVEGDRVGGTCVIRGCVPKKLLVYGSKYGDYIKSATSFGVNFVEAKIDTSILLANVRKEVNRLNKLHIELLQKEGVQLFKGWGQLISNNSVLVNDRKNIKESITLSAEKVLIAVGGRPVIPNIPGSSLGWVSDDIFLLKRFPKKIVIVGAGFIACEFACILNGLGVSITQLVRGKSLLNGFDEEISAFLAESMKKQGIDIQFQEFLESIEGVPGNIKVLLKNKKYLESEGILFATGRKPCTDLLRLNDIGVECDAYNIKVDSINRTNIPSIYAIGDVTSGDNLTPLAIAEGRAFSDRIFGNKNKKVNKEFIPKAVFSQPEVSSVGLSEEDANDQFGCNKIRIYRSKFRAMSESIPKNNKFCFLKLIIEIDTNKILGCHMAGESSAEIIQMASIAISMGATKNDFDNTMALHPTIAEEFVTMN